LQPDKLGNQFYKHRTILRITGVSSKRKVYAYENMDRCGEFRNLSFAAAVSISEQSLWKFYLWQKITGIAG
jgi:hypothetical protein